MALVLVFPMYWLEVEDLVWYREKDSHPCNGKSALLSTANPTDPPSSLSLVVIPGKKRNPIPDQCSNSCCLGSLEIVSVCPTEQLYCWGWWGWRSGGGGGSNCFMMMSLKGGLELEVLRNVVYTQVCSNWCCMLCLSFSFDYAKFILENVDKDKIRDTLK